MSYALQSILGYVSLTGLIQQVKSGIPDPLPPAFNKITRNVIGDSARFTQVTGERRTARLGQYGASAIRRELRNLATVDVKLMATFEEQPIPPLVLQQLRNYENYENMKLGMAEVSRQVKEFGRLFTNLRIATKLMVLFNGALWFDAGGNLLPTSSGAVETVSYNIPANNQNQLNGLIDVRWDNPTADIPKQLRKIKLQSIKDTGYELKYALYGKNVPDYLTNNDYVQDYLSRNPTMQAQFLESAEIPAGLFGFIWVPSYVSFFNDQNNAVQEIVGADAVTFCPEVSEEWWEILEGSYLVPNTIDIVADAAAGLAATKQVYGMFAFGRASINPPGLSTFAGDTVLPTLKNPNVVYSSSVIF